MAEPVREEPTIVDNDIITYDLFGRRSIFSSVEQTADNLVYEVSTALSIHIANMLEEERLYW